MRHSAGMYWATIFSSVCPRGRKKRRFKGGQYVVITSPLYTIISLKINFL